jgi:hypothetical protein
MSGRDKPADSYYLSDVGRGTSNLSPPNIGRVAAALSVSQSGLFSVVEQG